MNGNFRNEEFSLGICWLCNFRGLSHPKLELCKLNFIYENGKYADIGIGYCLSKLLLDSHCIYASLRGFGRFGNKPRLICGELNQIT